MKGQGPAINPTRINTVTRQLADPRRGTVTATDADLLGRFIDGRDQSAFADLVARHGPAVRAVCRSVLRDPNDADDAAQATFLVLVRRAGAVRDRAALGGWLCRVAWRTANRLRDDNRRRGDRTANGIDPDATPAAPACDAPDLAAVLDEIGKLPERYRVAVLTCYATGTPTAEAARQLGWPKGTLLTRLAWARKRLGDRLARRGVTLAGGLTAALAGRLGSAGAALFTSRTTQVAAAPDAQGAKGLVSERVLSLTNGVVRAMIVTKLKAAFGVGLFAVALFGLWLGRPAVGTAEANPGETKKVLPADKGDPSKAAADGKGKAAAEEKADAAPAGPGNDLVVRRPLGSYTREVTPFGRGTLTFTENRLHVHATVNLDGGSFTLTADADYSVNRESTVYGVVTGVDVTNVVGGDADTAAELALYAGMATDTPFAFRIRVEDESIVIKDIKFGPLGSPLFAEKLGKEGMEILALIAGKYKTDPNPDRNTVPPVARPKKK